MIVCQDLSKHFNGFIAVDGLNLRVQAGEVLALLGPNGAGKTTTVRMLTSVLRPTRGMASVAGFDVVRQAVMVRRSVGVLTEQHGLYGRMAADEYLDFFGRIYSMKAAVLKRKIDRLLEEFGLESDRKRRIGEYSKGMRQKLALARAMLHDPPVLLLDEPTSAMDPESARLVRDAIRVLRSGERSIVLCTHNLAEAEELADRIAIIRRGRIIANGSPLELKRQLLGPPEYEVCLGSALNGYQPGAHIGLQITRRGENWFRYRSVNPNYENPLLLKELIAQGLAVVSLQEVPRSLEQVYLQAMGRERTRLPNYANRRDNPNG